MQRVAPPQNSIGLLWRGPAICSPSKTSQLQELNRWPPGALAAVCLKPWLGAPVPADGLILDLCRHPKSESQLQRLEAYAAPGIDPPSSRSSGILPIGSDGEATARFVSRV